MGIRREILSANLREKDGNENRLDEASVEEEDRDAEEEEGRGEVVSQTEEEEEEDVLIGSDLCLINGYT